MKLITILFLIASFTYAQPAKLYERDNYVVNVTDSVRLYYPFVDADIDMEEVRKDTGYRLLKEVLNTQETIMGFFPDSVFSSEFRPVRNKIISKNPPLDDFYDELEHYKGKQVILKLLQIDKWKNKLILLVNFSLNEFYGPGVLEFSMDFLKPVNGWENLGDLGEIVDPHSLKYEGLLL